MPIACQSWEIGSGPTVGYKMQGQGGTGTTGSSVHGDGLGLNAIPRNIAAAFIYRPQQQQQQLPAQQLPQQGDSATGRTPVVKFAPCPTTVLVNSRTAYRHHQQQQQHQQQPQPQRLAVPSSTGDEWAPTTTNTVAATAAATATRLVPSAAGAGRGVLDALQQAVEAAGKELKKPSTTSMSSSSSIVTSSVSAGTSDECDDKEVQSAYKGPLEQMDTLMTTLPIRRGLSKFYNGKSRSFASLADVKSVKDLAKPDNPYAKRRRFVSNPVKDNHGKCPPPRLGGISKKTASNGTTLGLAVAMSGLDSEEHRSSGNGEGNRWQLGSRSFSLTDLRKA